MSTIIFSAMAVMVITIIILVAVLLFIKIKLTPKGTVSIDVNNGKKVLDVTPGQSLMSTLAEQKIFLPSACGGKANCGQCKVQVMEGGGTILPTEVGFFNRKQIKDNWRLGCQVKVKDNLKIHVAESALSVKKLECEVISNHNVATFIKEFTVKLPEGEHLEFKSGEYIQIDIPAYHLYFKDIEVEPEYRKDWEKYGFFNLESINPTATVRAYSMASYPGEKGIIKLNVRIATPPFDRSVPKELGPKLSRSTLVSLPLTCSHASLAIRLPSAVRSVSSFSLRTILRIWSTSSWAAVPVWPLCAATLCICSRP